MLHGGEIYNKKIEYDFSINLNPYPCPDRVVDNISKAVYNVNIYPDIEQIRFREAVASTMGDNITTENIIGGNGASELIAACIRMLNPGKVLMPVPSFYGYRHALNMLDGCEVTEFILKEDDGFKITTDFISQIHEGIDVVILANPNNPTGKSVDRDVLKIILNKCARVGAAIVVDECFCDLSDSQISAVEYVGKIPGLFVINAYTKLFSIPGVRVGFCIADKEDIIKLRRFLPEWNLSVFAYSAGISCAREIVATDYIEKSKELICKNRNYLVKKLKEQGIKVFDSDANFVLMKSDVNLYAKLLKQGILIRDCSNFTGLGPLYYRIAVKSKYEIDILTNKLIL